MSLANRLNQMIDEQKISKREFAKRVGVSENYVYTLTGESNKITTLSPMLAKVIAMEFGYDAEWILNGEKSEYHMSRHRFIFRAVPYCCRNRDSSLTVFPFLGNTDNQP